jgi:hypothetical protein
MHRFALVLAASFLILVGAAEAVGAALPAVPIHAIPLPSFELPKIVGQPIRRPVAAAPVPPVSLGEVSWWERLWTDPTATFTAAVALFTACLVAVSAYQGMQLSRTASIADRAAGDAERATQAAGDNAIAAARQAEAMDALRTTAQAQERVMREQAEATAAVAEAARQSAEVARRALTELERPYVVVEVTEPGIVVDAEGNFSLARSQPRWEALNFGRTPAILLDRLTVWLVEADDSMPYPIDPISQRGPQFAEGCVAAADHPFGETHNYLADLARIEDVLAPGAWKKCRIFFAGYVRYSDLLGGVYVTGFCLRFDYLGRRFVRIGGDAYNYTRTEKKSGEECAIIVNTPPPPDSAKF